MQSSHYYSWGRVQQFVHDVYRLDWLNGENFREFFRKTPFLLTYGLGRSYGDVCLNDGGILLDASGLNRFISFDENTGVLRCGAGVSIADILRFAAPRGFFVPVTPGTKFVTVGGAIANDVHGKNHHKAGTFGRHVLCFELRRSDGSVLLCSPEENKDYYQATIGGLGLTGVISWAEIQLKPIRSLYLEVQSVKFRSFEEFEAIDREAQSRWEYTVAWVDTLYRGGIRGHYFCGNHASLQSRSLHEISQKNFRLSIPLDAPEFLLGQFSMRVFNQVFFHKQLKAVQKRQQFFEPFFYPLDALLGWNRLYGKRGLFQFQCLIPWEQKEIFKQIFKTISLSGNGSFLAVLKTFGEIQSPGLLSFPRPGITLTLDFANRGEKTLGLLDQLARLTHEANGRLYPAKDSTMNHEIFSTAYPQWKEFERFIDPKFSSSFWRRVNP